MAQIAFKGVVSSTPVVQSGGVLVVVDEGFKERREDGAWVSQGLVIHHDVFATGALGEAALKLSQSERVLVIGEVRARRTGNRSYNSVLAHSIGRNIIEGDPETVERHEPGDRPQE